MALVMTVRLSIDECQVVGLSIAMFDLTSGSTALPFAYVLTH